jgi:hypothetical protein
MTDIDDREGPLPIVTIECPMCHGRVLPAHMTTMSGRRLCLDCANSWFEDDDESEKAD